MASSSWKDLARHVVYQHERSHSLSEKKHDEVEEGPTTQHFAALLKSCENAHQARHIHAQILESRHYDNTFLTNLVIEMYGKCGRLQDARWVFDRFDERNVFSWNIIVAAYARNGELHEARKLFERMPVKDVVSWNQMINAYAQNGYVEESKLLFDASPERNSYSWNMLISAYAQKGYLEEAKGLLYCMPEWDRVSWTTVISAYGNAGRSREAVVLFRLMDLEGVEADEMSFTAVLDACASHSTLSDGAVIHANIVECGLPITNLVATSLVNMYGKCGKLELAKTVFDRLDHRDLFLWTALIAAYAQWGDGGQAIRALWLMHLEGLIPDSVMLITILTSCNHSGLFKLSFEFFVFMLDDYGIHPNVHHYACMIDLVGKAGWLAAAEELLAQMPCKPDVASWTALLAAAKLHRDKELAKRASERLFELDPQNSAPYAMLVNIHKNNSMNHLRLQRGVRKLPGCSSIVVKDKLHVFVAGDVEHPQAEQIYDELERLKHPLTQAGYVPDTALVVHDQSLSEQEKERVVYSHSEKLAVAFGLITSTPGTSLRIVNNLRMCADCHAAMKLISKITFREVVVRDLIRFHLFNGGRCSCGDYW